MTAASASQGRSRPDWPRSLGVYSDLVYSRGPGGLYSDMAFGEYIAALAERVERVVVFGRLHPEREGGEHLLGSAVEFVELPYYERVADLAGLYRSLPGARRAFARVVPGLDAVWAFGPHPVARALVRAARHAGVQAMLGVRQDQPRYMRARLRGLRWLVGLPFFQYQELCWRRLARRLPTVVAGDDLMRIYGDGWNVRSTAFSLVREADLAARPHDRPAAGASDGAPFEIVTVGRLDPEKNPLLLAEIAVQLRELRPQLRFRIRVVGDGPLAGELSEAVRRHELDGQVELVGYVPYGPQLRAISEASDVFLHVSHTEGLPQTVVEALAAALPVVGTAVGGVPALLAPAGMPLVPPNDAAAAATALAVLADDSAHRHELALGALAHARDLTVEHQQADVIDFLRQAAGR